MSIGRADLPVSVNNLNREEEKNHSYDVETNHKNTKIK